mmetsp:Transcript_1811/g.1758  ORF Transcript_1811/g.1758 Transcript_1811/m.1758 type:complete len:94 (-) Transcript_1811:3-284(-)
MWNSVGPKMKEKSSFLNRTTIDPKTPQVERTNSHSQDEKLMRIGSAQNSTTNMRSSSTEASVKDLITIHVIDPVTKVKKEFKCNKFILQEEMK